MKHLTCVALAIALAGCTAVEAGSHDNNGAAGSGATGSGTNSTTVSPVVSDEMTQQTGGAGLPGSVATGNMAPDTDTTETMMGNLIPGPTESTPVELPATYEVTETTCTHWAGTFEVAVEEIPPEEVMDDKTLFLTMKPLDEGNLSNGAAGAATVDYRFELAAPFMPQRGFPGIFDCDGLFSDNIIHMDCEPLAGDRCSVVLTRD